MAVSSRAGSQAISLRFCKRRVNVLWARRSGRISGILRVSVQHINARHSQGTQGIDTEHSETGSC